MVLTLSAALLLGVLLALLLKHRTLGGGSALVAVLFGFFLASTGIAPTIRQVTANLADALTTIGH